VLNNKWAYTFQLLVTGGIARSASRRYLIYSDADFEVFRPTGATRCTDGGKIWRGVPSSMPNFTPIGAKTRATGPQKLKFLLRFDQYVEHKRPADAYPVRNFHKICRVCTSFQDALACKTLLDLLKGSWSYGGFKLRGSDYPQIFSAP